MSLKRHAPIRMCVGCRKRRKKSEMLRFSMAVRDGVLVFDKRSRVGRGFYLCPDDSCFKAAKKRWRFENVEDHGNLSIET